MEEGFQIPSNTEVGSPGHDPGAVVPEHLQLHSEGVPLMVQVVDEIASEPNGKFRPYRSHIPRIASD